MEEYRLYLLGPDGRIEDRVDVVGVSEVAARERAEKLARDSAVELWQGARKIAEYPAKR